MIIRTDKMLFITDPDNSDKSIENLLTEHDTQVYRIKIDRTMWSPWYQLFRGRKEGKRQLWEELFCSSKLEKIVKFINENFKNKRV